ncbi:MAG: PilZ domain-containing protein [Phycisphaerae bacterium]|jgi:hypothetical protein
MKGKERRTDRRLRLRVPLSCNLTHADHTVVTTNISTGGMYIQLSKGVRIKSGSDLNFELLMPPGDGYSHIKGKVKGSGKIVRVDALAAGHSGLAVQFTHPLTLSFPASYT